MFENVHEILFCRPYVGISALLVDRICCSFLGTTYVRTYICAVASAGEIDAQ